MHKRERALDLTRFLEFAKQISGPHAFSTEALFLASLLVVLNRISVIAFKGADPVVYVLCAAILSQIVVFIFLILSGKAILQITNTALRATFVVAAYLVSTFLGGATLNLLFKTWSIEQVNWPQWQILLNALFTVLIFLAFNWAMQYISENFSQVKSSREILDELFGQRIRLIQTVNDGRNFAGRELFLDVEASRGAIESFESRYEFVETYSASLATLKHLISGVEAKLRVSAKPIARNSSRLRQVTENEFSFGYALDSVTRENRILPISMSVITLCGLGTWLGYFVDTQSLVFWGEILSLIGFSIFWIYQKLLAPKLLTLSITTRIIVFEVWIIYFLFFWIFLLGFIAGDDSTSYGVALINAFVPFLFFNGAVVMAGRVNLSQLYRAELVIKASILRTSLIELEALRAFEADAWKALFAGDIATSPTTASVMLQELTLTRNDQVIKEVLHRAVAIWNSVESKVPMVPNWPRDAFA